MTGDSIPYLDFPQRVRYLIEREYFDEVALARDEQAFLESINFHYFLGYARNFRKMRPEVKGFSSASISELIEVVRLDQELSCLLFEGLRMLEWRLRAAFVDSYCATHESVNSYHVASTYARDELDQPIHEAVLRQVIRSKEPYIVEHISGRGEYASGDSMAKIDELVSGLPIWSVIDSISFGTLVRMIRHTRRVSEEDEFMWKLVSSAIETPHQMIHEYLVAAHTLRNLVAHHSRLWMRPTTNTPKFPNTYKREKRNAHPKSMYVMILSLSICLLKVPGGKDFKDRVDELLSTSSAFRHGIRQVFIESKS